jgi:hypothetical protein
MSNMKLVYLESRYAGDIATNVRYARLCMLDCLRRGEAPFASHLLYTQCLNDADVNERTLGMKAGFCFAEKCELTVVYEDLGISRGMQAGIDHALEFGRKVEFRKLPNWSIPVPKDSLESYSPVDPFPEKS